MFCSTPYILRLVCLIICSHTRPRKGTSQNSLLLLETISASTHAEAERERLLRKPQETSHLQQGFVHAQRRGTPVVATATSTSSPPPPSALVSGREIKDPTDCAFLDRSPPSFKPMAQSPPSIPVTLRRTKPLMEV